MKEKSIPLIFLNNSLQYLKLVLFNFKIKMWKVHLIWRTTANEAHSDGLSIILSDESCILPNGTCFCLYVYSNITKQDLCYCLYTDTYWLYCLYFSVSRETNAFVNVSVAVFSCFLMHSFNKWILDGGPHPWTYIS